LPFSLQRAAVVLFSSSSVLVVVVVSVSVVVVFDTLPFVSSFVVVVLDEKQLQCQVVLLTNGRIVPLAFAPPSFSAVVAVVGYSEQYSLLVKLVVASFLRTWMMVVGGISIVVGWTC